MAVNILHLQQTRVRLDQMPLSLAAIFEMASRTSSLTITCRPRFKSQRSSNSFTFYFFIALADIAMHRPGSIDPVLLSRRIQLIEAVLIDLPKLLMR